MVQNDYDRNSKNILGKLRANFVGTEFQLYDAGRSPKEFIDPFMTDMDKSKEMRSELGVILYARNVLGSKGPRKMQICLNKVNEEDDSASVWQPSHKDEDMLTVFKHRRQPAVKKLFMLQNKKPMWNDSVGAFVLNFNGRVTMASVKNFQLTEEGYDDSIILQVCAFMSNIYKTCNLSKINVSASAHFFGFLILQYSNPREMTLVWKNPKG